jgi:hypothetical protein
MARLTNWSEQLPSFMSQHGRRTDLPGHVEVPRPSALGQSRTRRPRPCAPRLPPRTMGVPVKPGPRTGSTMPIPLLARREHGLQGSLIEEQCLPCGSRDTTGEGVNECRPCAVMMVISAHHSITPASVIGWSCLTSVRHPSPGVLSFEQRLRGEDVW